MNMSKTDKKKKKRKRKYNSSDLKVIYNIIGLEKCPWTPPPRCFFRLTAKKTLVRATGDITLIYF